MAKTINTEPSLGGKKPDVDFTNPAGEPALCSPDSVAWRVFKNPVALFIGGVAAVILELAEPRIRSGVWDNTSFKDNPLPRMERTGLAAMVTVYGARSTAEKMIAGITRMHARVNGTTPEGVVYSALDQELMDWVQATASFGFLQAYNQFVTPVSKVERDQFYSDARPSAYLYGAHGAPASEAELLALFETMAPKLGRNDTVFEFLEIMNRTPALPRVLRPLQKLFIRAGIQILPADTRAILALGGRYDLNGIQLKLISLLGKLADKIPLTFAPPAQACKRMGLPANYLYR